MNTRDILARASKHIEELRGHVFDVLTVQRPVSPAAAVNLAKIISKLSPLVGNLIEFNTVEVLNDQEEFKAVGRWVRQDPGFPDAIFVGEVRPTPGLEIKAWFPLATEITARFRDSQTRFLEDDNTYIALIAWLPEHVIYGRPRILNACVVSALSVAIARDQHYHKPPDYLVVEPEDTSGRTQNLQQTNTAGYKWQGTPEDFEKAKIIVQGWGDDAYHYQPTPAYQEKVRQLIGSFNYRLDTNFAKLDRIVHQEIEEFKREVAQTVVHGLTVEEWSRLFASRDEEAIQAILRERLGIREEKTDQLLE